MNMIMNMIMKLSELSELTTNERADRHAVRDEALRRHALWRHAIAADEARKAGVAEVRRVQANTKRHQEVAQEIGAVAVIVGESIT